MHQKVHDCLLSITGASFCHACISGPIVMDLLGKNYIVFPLNSLISVLGKNKYCYDEINRSLSGLSENQKYVRILSSVGKA